MSLREDADRIIAGAIKAVLPEEAVRSALRGFAVPCHGRVVLVAIGKAAWRMASAASGELGDRITRGLVVTKHGHSMGPIKDFEIIEAGHPMPDRHSYDAADKALALVHELSAQDRVLFLVSGGGSALFEQPLVPPEEMADINEQLLRSGADITQVNTIRKRLSNVKGGRFGLACAPAQVVSVILSDIIGDPLDMIASGPAAADTTTCAQAINIAQRYSLRLSEEAFALLKRETPKRLPHVTSMIAGNVKALCAAAEESCRSWGYTAVTLADSVDCQARDLGLILASIARRHQDTATSLAFLMGGETVVQVTGNGKGGRNQEVALSAAAGIDGLCETSVFSFGSDGTDGPTDAAGGFVDTHTLKRMRALGIDAVDALTRNDAYPALSAVDGLIITGPTGTNVNDLSVVLIKR